MRDALGQRRLGRQLGVLRLLAVPVAVTHVATSDFPEGYRPWALGTCAALAAAAVVLLALERRPVDARPRTRLAVAGVAVDTAVVAALLVLYSFVDGQPTWALFFVPTLEAALRFGIVGGVIAPLVTAPLLVAAEAWRADHFAPQDFRPAPVGVRIALAIVLGGFVGQLATAFRSALDEEAARAHDSERMRDELGRRLDAVEAANRCARALASSLLPDEAFDAFVRELRGIVPFDRLLVVALEDGRGRVIARAGLGVEHYPPRSEYPASATIVERILDGRTVYRRDLAERPYDDEEHLLQLGLGSRVVVPLQVGARTIGFFSLSRLGADAYAEHEIELVSLLGRLIAGTVQNIRTYEVEREAAEELRRLSALRSDFVSMVSHELRSPMAAVVGAARTLRQREDELTAQQRNGLVVLIAREAERLGALVRDVLDTSRLEAGTLRYAFGRVDVRELVRESVEAAAAGQGAVRVAARVERPVPPVRGDRDRLRQVIQNLVENAVKYSPEGAEVNVAAGERNGLVTVDVSDAGPGIAAEDQALIFEKFGRAQDGAGGRPGTGLGLFIARSIAEAHGGTLTVRSTRGRGATFTLALPATEDEERS